MQTVIILSISSDIGRYLAQRYLSQGYRVVGTFRDDRQIARLKKNANCHLFACDVHDVGGLTHFAGQVKQAGWRWDVFISCVGDPLPLTAFFASDFDHWQRSVEINSLDQLRALHLLYPLRRRKKITDAVFFAGGGANNAVVNFSAYTIGKIMLTKMCEFIDAESKDLNMFIVGPGWTKTKVHQTIINDPHVPKEKRAQTLKFLTEKKGTPLSDIFECIQWLRAEGKSVAGGRNFSIAYDPWKKNKRQLLVKELAKNPDMYKLRRHHNQFLQD